MSGARDPGARLRDRAAIVVWLVALATAVAIIVHTRFVADLTAFLPTRPSAEQALLIDQLREGPASHLVLVAIDGNGTDLPDATLAALSRETAARIRGDRHFLSINNGETVNAAGDRALLFDHRYLLSDRVTAQRFTVAGLRDALGESLDLLSSSAGLMLQPLITRDPTAELLHLVDTLTAGRDLPSVDGVWVLRSKEQGRHALLVAETKAEGADIDGQQVALNAMRAAFDEARKAVAASTRASTGASSGASTAGARLVLSGPPVFAVDARNTIERDALRLSTIGAVLVALLLGFVYRSPRALVLGLLPMISGALCGLAIVAAGFGVVHGIALGFGVTLIGEAVDYGIYLFVQGPQGSDGVGAEDHGSVRSRGFWTTIALGVATSAIGFAALMFSGFPGLQQIGLLSIAGLVVAALVTRFVVPAFLPAGFSVRPMPTLGRFLVRLVSQASRLRWVFVLVALASIVVLVVHRDALWSRELSSLSPVSIDLQRTDGRLRSELGAPDVRDVVVIRAIDEEAALRACERVVDALAPLVANGTLVGMESPSRYLPSRATQRARQHALPDGATLRRDFAQALDGLPFVKTGFDAFFADVERARTGPLLTRADLDGSSLGPALRALLPVPDASSPTKRWTAVVALRSPSTEGPASGDAPSPRARVAAAVAPLSAAADPRTEEIRAIDIGTETQGLYAGYLSEALHLAGIGALAIVVLLAVFLRSAARLARVLLPIAIAVVIVAGAHVAFGGPLTLFHFIGLLLIVAVGSNYTLFFDRRLQIDSRADDGATGQHRLLISMAIANLTSAIGFGVLGLSSLPVLNAIGTTVAPGALLALAGAAAFAAVDAQR